MSSIKFNKNTKMIECDDLTEDDEGLTNVLLPIEKTKQTMNHGGIHGYSYKYTIHVKDYDEVTNLSMDKPEIKFDRNTGNLKCIGSTAIWRVDSSDFIPDSD